MVFKFTRLRDRQFQDGQLFTITGLTSAVQCARLCSANTQCHTFTFTPEGSQLGSGSRSGSCQAHDVVVTSESSSTSVVGAVTYQLFKNGDGAWLGSSCVANTACARPPTKCLQGQCMCTPGYYFSLRSNMCVQLTLLLTSPLYALPVQTTISPSQFSDVTAPSSQSETTSGGTTPRVETSTGSTNTVQSTISLLSVKSLADASTESTVKSEESRRESRLGAVESDAGMTSRAQDGGLLAQGQRAIKWLAFAIAQTNVTCNSLCSEMSEGDPNFCSVLENRESPSLPSLHAMLKTAHKKNVYTSVLAAYNVTYQYTSLLERMYTTMHCDDCDVSIDCADVDHPSSDVSLDTWVSCQLADLKLHFYAALCYVAQMLITIHGTVPDPPPTAPLPSVQDITARREVYVMILAEARDQLSKAKDLIEQRVVDQLW
ncbi:hypothetical protein ACOMHN_027649 [Nucella lapillus]